MLLKLRNRMFLKRLRQKVRYNNIFRLIQDILVKLGIRFSLFYLKGEELNRTISGLESNELSNYEVGFFNDQDVIKIAELGERRSSSGNLLKLLQDGCICYGVKKNGKIIAFTWFNLHECPFKGYMFKLKETEAYVFDTYTLIEYRGRRIASYMRYQSYKELRSLGKTYLYSIVEVFNKQSNRHAEKLGVQILLMGLYIDLFQKWRFRYRIRLYENTVPQV